MLSLAWTPVGRRLAASGDRVLRIWATDGPSEPVELQGPLPGVNAVAWNPDGSRLASGESDGTVLIWDPTQRQKVQSLAGHTSVVLSVAWSPDGRRLASAGEDNSIWIRDPESGTTAAVLRGHANHVRALAWSPDGTRLASGGEDRSVPSGTRATGARSWRLGAIKPRSMRWRGVRTDADSPRAAMTTACSSATRARDTPPSAVEPSRPAPVDPRAHRLRAEALSRRGDWDGAAAKLRQAIAKGSIDSASPPSAGWWAAGPFEILGERTKSGRRPDPPAVGAGRGHGRRPRRTGTILAAQPCWCGLRPAPCLVPGPAEGLAPGRRVRSGAGMARRPLDPGTQPSPRHRQSRRSPG